MAVPNPERELKRLADQLKSGLPEVLVVSGASKWFRSEAMDRVLAAVPKDADIRHVDGTENSDGRELDDLAGAGLFGSGSVVVVRRAEGWVKSFAKELEARVPKIAPGCALVLEVQKLDKRTKLSKMLLSTGEGFDFRELYGEPFGRSRGPLDSEVVRFLVTRARGLKMDLTPEAALLVRSVVGDDPAELVPELKRLQQRLEGQRTVGPEDLRGHLRVAFESTPFEFAEAVLAFDRARAERSLSAMFGRGIKSRDGSAIDPAGVLPMVASWSWQSFANVLHGRNLLDSGHTMADVVARCGVRHFTERFEAQVQKNPAARLRLGLSLLVELQRGLRTTGESPEWLLQSFVAGYFGQRRPTPREVA